MLSMLLVFGLLFQASTAPAPLTAQQVLEAHQAGVSAQGLLNMIAANPAVAPATNADLLALAQAGVPAVVVDAFRARLASPPAAAPPPMDPRLGDIVRLVRSGLSEDLIIRQIRSSGEVYKLSVVDLIFLKDSQVPEAIIVELITSQNTQTGLKAAAPSTLPSSFGPLVRMTGFLRKDSPGALHHKDGRLEWLDTKKAERNFSLTTASIKTVCLACSPRPQGNYCYEIGLVLFNGDVYEFRDAEWETGINTQILALFDMLKKSYPQIIFQERVN